MDKFRFWFCIALFRRSVFLKPCWLFRYFCAFNIWAILVLFQNGAMFCGFVFPLFLLLLLVRKIWFYQWRLWTFLGENLRCMEWCAGRIFWDKIIAINRCIILINTLVTVAIRRTSEYPWCINTGRIILCVHFTLCNWGLISNACHVFIIFILLLII